MMKCLETRVTRGFPGLLELSPPSPPYASSGFRKIPALTRRRVFNSQDSNVYSEMCSAAPPLNVPPPSLRPFPPVLLPCTPGSRFPPKPSKIQGTDQRLWPVNFLPPPQLKASLLRFFFSLLVFVRPTHKVAFLFLFGPNSFFVPTPILDRLRVILFLQLPISLCPLFFPFFAANHPPFLRHWNLFIFPPLILMVGVPPIFETIIGSWVR